MRDTNIACPICQRVNPEFEELTTRINCARALQEKAFYAQELLKKAEKVVQEHGPASDPLGQACRIVLGLRKKTAELILKTQKLG